MKNIKIKLMIFGIIILIVASFANAETYYFTVPKESYSTTRTISSNTVVLHETAYEFSNPDKEEYIKDHSGELIKIDRATKSTINYFQNPATELTSHLIVDRRGNIWVAKDENGKTLIESKRWAYHAGSVGNKYWGLEVSRTLNEIKGNIVISNLQYEGIKEAIIYLKKEKAIDDNFERKTHKQISQESSTTTDHTDGDSVLVVVNNLFTKSDPNTLSPKEEQQPRSQTQQTRDPIISGPNQNVGDWEWAKQKILENEVVRLSQYTMDTGGMTSRFSIGDVDGHSTIIEYQIINNFIYGKSIYGFTGKLPVDKIDLVDNIHISKWNEIEGGENGIELPSNFGQSTTSTTSLQPNLDPNTGEITLTSNDEGLHEIKYSSGNTLPDSGYIVIGANNNYYNLNSGDVVRVIKGNDGKYYIANNDGSQSNIRIYISSGDSFFINIPPNTQIQPAEQVQFSSSPPKEEDQQPTGGLSNEEESEVDKALGLDKGSKKSKESKFGGTETILLCSDDRECKLYNWNQKQIDYAKKEIEAGRSDKNLVELKGLDNLINILQGTGAEISVRNERVVLTTVNTQGDITERTEKIIDADGKIESTHYIKIKKTEDGQEVISHKVVSSVILNGEIVRTVRTYDAYKFEQGTGNWEEVWTNQKGESVRLILVEGEFTYTAVVEDGKVVGSEKAKKILNTKRSQESWRSFFANIDSFTSDFRGLGYYATWFDDDWIEGWREDVDGFFAENYLGMEYWESDICSFKIDRDTKGVAYVDTRTGLASVAAHIEASRSQEILLPQDFEDGKEYLYKITFNVKNGDFRRDPRALEKMEFKIELRGERTFEVFDKKFSLNKGESIGRVGANAIVQFSTFKYDKICIVFDEVSFAWSLDGKELCNKIPEAPTKATKIDEEKEKEEEEEKDPEINDF